jgi:hypothetical protein
MSLLAMRKYKSGRLPYRLASVRPRVRVVNYSPARHSCSFKTRNDMLACDRDVGVHRLA